MLEAVKQHDRLNGGWLVGNERPEDIATSWEGAGFSAEEAEAWWAAGCWDADCTAALRDAGLTPAQVSVAHPDGESYGYRCCNGDCVIDDIPRD
jgi:hypothetical protein